MKLLIENWKSYLTEQADGSSKIKKEEDPETINSNIEHNYKFLSDKKLVVSLIANRYGEKLIEPEELSSITPLAESRIVKIVAQGTQGVVFKLSNGRLLKIYKGIHHQESNRAGVEKENARYQNIMKKAHSGMSYKGELPVYDSGIVYIGGLYLGWVEMGRVLVFKDYADIISNFDEDLSYNKQLKAGNFVFDRNIYGYYGILRQQQSSINSIKDFHNSNALKQIKRLPAWTEFSFEFGEDFAQKLIDALIQLWLDNDKDFVVFSDLHVENFGILNLSDPTPVIFDI